MPTGKRPVTPYRIGARLRKTHAALLCVSLLCGVLTGCGGNQTVATALTDDGGLNPGFTEERLGLDYETPRMTPVIKVDQIGFRAEDVKQAFLTGAQLPSVFQVIDLSTGEVVYEGKLTSRGTDSGVADFSKLKEEGRYYIHADIVGDSYAFTIGETVYADALGAVMKQFYLNRCGVSLTEQYAGDGAHSVCHTTAAALPDAAGKTKDVMGGWHLDGRLNRNVIEGCHAMDQLLLAYELHTEAFTDETGIPESGNDIPDILDEVAYEAAWLLKMQDEATGGVYAAAMTDGAEDANPMLSGVTLLPISMEATGAFAAAMAHFSSQYQGYDEDFATQCVQAADKAFKLYAASQETTDSAVRFQAACELYRATSGKRYASVIEGFFQEEAYQTMLTKDDGFFYGALAYLATSGEVDKKACGKMMDALMEGARQIAEKAEASMYLVADGDVTQEEVQKQEDGAGSAGDADIDLQATTVLQNVRVLNVVNHILYNYEYQTLIDNHVQYLMGRNPAAVNLVTDDSEFTYREAGLTGVRTNPLQAARLVFLLSSIEQGKT